MTNQNKKLHIALYIVVTWFTACPSTAWAHGDFGPLVAAIFIGPVLAIIVTVFLPVRRTGLKFLLFFPVLAGCILLTGLIAGSLSQANLRQRNADYQARIAGFDADPIAQAACALDTASVKRLTSGPVSDAQQTRFGEILVRCAFGDEPQRKEIFAHLMPKITAIQNRTTKDGVVTTYDYCNVLQIVHQGQRKAYLQVLLDQKLPINCITLGGERVWRAGLNFGLSNAGLSTTSAAMSEWAEYLQKNGVALGQRGGKNPYGVHDTSTLINLMINQGSFELVMMGLNAGLDTDLYARPANHINSPIELWTVRRFKTANGLSEAQVREIQDKFGDLTAKQANRTKSGHGATLLWGLQELQDNADGGAAFFSYLVSRGADLGARDQWGSSALHDLQSVSKPLLAEFDRLSPEQFKALVLPIDGPNSLLEAAKRKGNTVLVNYLCTKGAKC
jgi:hypothetical protein